MSSTRLFVVIAVIPVLVAAGACGESSPPADGSADARAPDAPADRGEVAPASDLRADLADAAMVDAATADARAPDTTTPFVPGPDPKSAALFDETRIVDFHVTFPPGEWDKLLTSRAEASQRWVRCGFRFGAESFPAASCRRKGNMFDWDRTAAKPQFVVRFNHADKQARFRGMRRLNFEAFSGYAAPVRDRLGMWLMREAGIDASRVNHARVWKDGQLLGLYQNVEVVDHELLEDHFGPDAEGNLWEGGVELETNEAANDRAVITTLERLVEDEPMTGEHKSFFPALAAIFDMRQVLREMAAETVMLANDNFSNNLRNFYYYEHPRRGVLVLPWDFDTILTAGPIDADPFEFWSNAEPGKLRLLINQNPTWRAEFVDHVVEIRDRILTRMPPLVDAFCDQIREAVREDPGTLFKMSEFEDDCRAVKDAIPARIAALKAKLGR